MGMLKTHLLSSFEMGLATYIFGNATKDLIGFVAGLAKD